MLSQYLNLLGSKPHETIYKFFTNLHFTNGLFVAIGFNEAKPLKGFRVYNRTFRIALFEQNPFEEKQIKAQNWLAGKGFEYHMVKLSKSQSIETVFVPKVGGTRVVKAATTDEETFHAYKNAEAKPAGRPGLLNQKKELDEVVVETRVFDHFKLAADIISVAPDHFEREVFEGMTATIQKYQPIIVVPNLLPTIFDVHEMLIERKYRAYSYDAGKNRVIPFENNTKAEQLIYIHTFMFETDVPLDMD
ncbi:MAG TPA: hypothetical protein VGH19_00185 [Verrucomicrobiae bacterium]